MSGPRELAVANRRRAGWRVMLQSGESEEAASGSRSHSHCSTLSSIETAPGQVRAGRALGDCVLAEGESGAALRRGGRLRQRPTRAAAGSGGRERWVGIHTKADEGGRGGTAHGASLGRRALPRAGPRPGPPSAAAPRPRRPPAGVRADWRKKKFFIKNIFNVFSAPGPSVRAAAVRGGRRRLLGLLRPPQSRAPGGQRGGPGGLRPGGGAAEGGAAPCARWNMADSPGAAGGEKTRRRAGGGAGRAVPR